MKARMTDRLALRGELVPAYEGIIHPNKGVDEVYLTATDLEGSQEMEANQYFSRVRLKNGRVFYVAKGDITIC
jgi:hypothetical protein